MLRKMALAIPQAILHRRAFSALTEGLREEHANQLVDWERMVREWTVDHSQPNPYEIPEDSKSLRCILWAIFTNDFFCSYYYG